MFGDIVVIWLVVGFIDCLAWQWAEQDWSGWGFIYITLLGPIGLPVGYMLLRERFTGKPF